MLAALVVLIIALPVLLMCVVLILVIDRQPPLFAAQRLKAGCRSFRMWKLRTMRGADDGLPTGAEKTRRITRMGVVLRRLRLDELPQIWNVLLGDMNFIGPRPPTPAAAAQFPEEFEKMLAIAPGMTGLGTVSLALEEQRIMASSSSLSELEVTYVTRILPCKFEIERYYRDHKSIWLDCWIMWKTLAVILARPGAGPVPDGRPIIEQGVQD
jgi:lipopolysaccharide/colanic/teichoic acid biosynthesis glycosyltransferase